MKISAYCTTRNAEEMEYPYLESIQSHLAFADEVVVYDSSDAKDKTLETLQTLATTEPKLKVIHNDKIDWNTPNHGVYDGYTKSLSRKQCTGEILWQFDIDEVVHEKHVPMIRPLAETFYKQNAYDLMALPVIEYWGRHGKVRIDVNIWKWRLSKNKSSITHGIPLQLRKYENGLLYAHHGTDGCDYISSITGNIIPCANFIPPGFDQLRMLAIKDNSLLPKIEKYINDINGNLPGVFHYSWFNIERKIRNYKTFWTKFWPSMYNETRDEKNNPMFPGLTWKEITNDMIKEKALELEQGTGGHVFHRPWDGVKNNAAYIEMNHPNIMKFWIEGNK